MEIFFSKSLIIIPQCLFMPHKVKVFASAFETNLQDKKDNIFNLQYFKELYLINLSNFRISMFMGCYQLYPYPYLVTIKKVNTLYDVTHHILH